MVVVEILAFFKFENKGIFILSLFISENLLFASYFVIQIKFWNQMNVIILVDRFTFRYKFIT